MISCIIIEDQSPAQRVLKKYITDYGELDLRGTFFNAIDGLEFLKHEPVDLIFLDIHLPRISGMEFLRTLPQTPAVILTTAFTDYALESYEHGVIDYLVKPFSFERFAKAVSKVNPTMSPGFIPALECMIKSGHEYIKFNSTEVCYICTDMDYTEIRLTDKKHLSKETLSHWEQTLHNYGFVRTHKSYLVNFAYVQKLTSTQVHLSDGTILPVGRAYKEQVLSKWVTP